MAMRPLLFLFGSRRISVKREKAAFLVDLCGRRGWIYRNLSFDEHNLYADCSPSVGKKLKAACEKAGVEIVCGKIGGLPGLVLKYRKRYGLICGLLACCWILFASGRFLWSIRVEGNERWSDGEIIRELEECGLRIGIPVDGVNTAVLENRILMASDKISWISINMNGNVAHAVIREKEAASDRTSEDTAEAVNLVAERAGEIVWFEEVRGNIAVEIGDLVSKGSLLVGGIYGKDDGPLRYTRASGSVMARTERRFEVRIPLRYEKKEYTGTVKTEKYLIFFEKEVKFFGNTGNWSGTCDTIDTVEYFEAGRNALLPVGIRTVRYAEYRTVTVERSAEQAEELARLRLRALTEREVPDGTLVRKTENSRWNDDALTLTCRAEFFENIAIPVKIELEGFGAPTEKK